MIKLKGTIASIGDKKQISDKFAVQPIVITTEGQYPKTIAIQLVRKALEKAMYLVVGAPIECDCDVESKEYNGKYYTNINCFQII